MSELYRALSFPGRGAAVFSPIRDNSFLLVASRCSSIGDKWCLATLPLLARGQASFFESQAALTISSPISLFSLYATGHL